MPSKIGKTHISNWLDKPMDYPDSPHVFNAISEGRFTVCRLITTRISSVHSEATCKHCLVIYKSKRPIGYVVSRIRSFIHKLLGIVPKLKVTKTTFNPSPYDLFIKKDLY